MKQSRVVQLVWLICLSLPATMAAAPFTHLHAGHEQETEHHDGPVVHRHAPAAHDHHSEPDSGQPDAPPAPMHGASLDGALGLPAATEAPVPSADSVSLFLSAPAPRATVARAQSERSGPPDCDAVPPGPRLQPSPLRGPPR